MRVQIESLGEGLHSGEIVIALDTKSGREELVVDKDHLSGDTLEIGYPVGQEDGYYLIELPNETFRGSWRVWVARGLVHEEERQRKIA